MPSLYYSAVDAAQDASHASYLWVILPEASKVRLPAPWFPSRIDTVNGEQARLFMHPQRMQKDVEFLDGLQARDLKEMTHNEFYDELY